MAIRKVVYQSTELFILLMVALDVLSELLYFLRCTLDEGLLSFVCRRLLPVFTGRILFPVRDSPEVIHYLLVVFFFDESVRVDV